MGKLEVLKSHPTWITLGSGRCLWSPTTAQKRAIATVDQRAAISDEGDRAVPQCRRFPRIVGYACLSEEDLSDIPIGRAVKMTVHGLQHGAQAASSLSCKARVETWRAIVEQAPQAYEGFDAIEAAVIEWHDGSKRFTRSGVVDKEQMKCFPVCRKLGAHTP